MSYLTTPYVVYSGFQTVGTLRNMLIAALGTAQARGRRIVALGDSRATPTGQDRKSTRLNSSHIQKSRMPSSA